MRGSFVADQEGFRRPVIFLREPFVSPFSRRVLLVVAAAIRSATLFERPRAVSLRLMCSYCRLRFALFTRVVACAHLHESRISSSVRPQNPDHTASSSVRLRREDALPRGVS